MFITFEGIEGSGKSTQAAHVYEYLVESSVPALLTREPGGTMEGEGMRDILLSSSNHGLVADAELLLYAADRAQHVMRVIKPALDQGKWVLCDRFVDATVAYQGYARGIDMEFVNCLNKRVCYGVWPDLTFLFDLPVEEGLRRAWKRNLSLDMRDQGRFENEALTFHEAVRRGYRYLSKSEPGRFFVVDATLPEREITNILVSHLEKFLGQTKIMG